jgi:hypothetical protein
VSVRKSKVALSFDMDDHLFDHLFFRQLACDGSIYLRASESERKECMNQRTKFRHIPDTRPNGSDWDLQDILNVGYSKRLHAYKADFRKAVEQGLLARDANMFCNIEQDASAGHGQCSFVIPTLVRNSTLVKVSAYDAKDVLLTHLESMAIMGWPMSVTSLAQPTSLGPPLSGLPHRVVRSFAGNAMHVCVCGCVVVYALGASRLINTDDAEADGPEAEA